MPRAKPTTKARAKRINPHYFKHPSTFGSWMRWFSIALPVLALLWIVSKELRGRHDLYSPGPLSSAHAAFGSQCGVCHMAQAGISGPAADDGEPFDASGTTNSARQHVRFRRTVTTKACLACHDAPSHHENEAMLPGPDCATCHVEHRGAVQLAHTEDRTCTACHQNLLTQKGSPRFAQSISGFHANHPEFAAARPGSVDPGTIKFNHRVHLRRNLPTLDASVQSGMGERRSPMPQNQDLPAEHSVQLQCTDCHRATATGEPWPYGEADPFKSASLVADTNEAPPSVDYLPPSRDPRQAYMGPLNYYLQCSTCHPLYFDQRFREVVPHQEPADVKKFLVEKFQQYLKRYPSELRARTVSLTRLPHQQSASPPRNAPAWVAQQVAQAERLLWGKTCKECHALTYADGASMPSIARAKITPRWMMHASFNHQKHQMLSCTACHTRVTRSENTADVLLPQIATCQKCHVEDHKDAAEGRCFECHAYHDWKHQKPIKVRQTLSELLVMPNMPTLARIPAF